MVDFYLVFILFFILMLRLSHSMIENAPSELVKDACNESKELMAKINGILETMMHVLVFLQMDARTASAITTTLSKISIQLAISTTKYTNSNRACSIQHLLLYKKLFGLVSPQTNL